jgi:hypothetical protein
MPIALIASLLSALPTAAGFTVRTRIAPGPDQQARAVARMVGGIISYTRWPGEPVPATRLCVMGKARFAGRLGEAAQVAGRTVSVSYLADGATTVAQGCDVLYLGALAAGAGQRAIASIRGRGVLSIAESDPACRGGTMFCLDVDSGEISFRLSLDAISRGTVRVDPRVLRLSDANEDES